MDFDDKSFISIANKAGQELFRNFFPKYISNIIIEHFSVPMEKIASLTNNSMFNDFIKEYENLLIQKYGLEIEISKVIIDIYSQITFIIIKFDKKEHQSIMKSLFMKKCTESFLISLKESYANKHIDFYHFDFCSFILRNATNYLFMYISRELTNNENLMLFSYIEDLSKLTYEKKKLQGLVLFYPSNEIENVDFQFRFTEKKEFSKKNIKLVRKLLELTDENSGLVCDTRYIYGVGHKSKEIKYYALSFFSNNSWQLKSSNKIILNYKNNKEVTINSEQLLMDELKNSFRTVFEKDIDDDNFSEAIKQLVKENNGTILVISTKAKNLISEYEDLCIRIEPEQLTKKNIRKLSAIDGAIITDENGICYGFGVVLDGLDTRNGNPARGSRYNSSERFFAFRKRNLVEKNDEKLLVFVLSDDGNYNIFPPSNNS